MATQELQEFWQEGRDAWPTLALEPRAFIEYSQESVISGEVRHAEDLYLAVACALKVLGASDILVREHGASIDLALAGMRVSDSFKDDVRQLVFEKLLLGGEGKPAQIGTYRGRGRLRSWLRTVAVRSALDVLRAEKSDPVLAGDTLLPFLIADIEESDIAALKSKYREEVNQAFASALSTLSRGDRTLLHRYYIQGNNIDDLATVYGIHRVTAFRRVLKVKEALFRDVRVQFARLTDMRDEDSDDIIKLLQSQVDISVSRILRAD